MKLNFSRYHLNQPDFCDFVNPYFFIVGCPRSGTTLLQRILDAHPDLAVMFEGQWILKVYQQGQGIDRAGLVTEEIVKRLFEHVRFPYLGLTREEICSILESSAPTTYAHFVSLVCDLYAHKKGKRLMGDKTPGYVRGIKTLTSLWPDCKFVHIIRDGRDVCLAALDWRGAHPIRSYPTWKVDKVATIALWWERYIRLGRDAAQELAPHQYYEIRYEQMVTDPVSEVQRLCTFLEVPYSHEMLRFNEKHNRTRISALPDTNAKWWPVTSGLRDWRFQMFNPDLELFETVSGNLLRDLGYHLATSSISRKKLEEATKLRRNFIKYLQGRGSVLPKEWSQVNY